MDITSLMYVYRCTWMDVHMCMHTHEGLRSPQVSSSGIHPSLETGPPTDPELTLSCTVQPVSLTELPVSASQTLRLQACVTKPSYFTWVSGSSSGPHLQTNTVWAELALCPYTYAQPNLQTSDFLVDEFLTRIWFFFKFVLCLICMIILTAYMSVYHMCVWCLWKSEDSIRGPGAWGRWL